MPRRLAKRRGLSSPAPRGEHAISRKPPRRECRIVRRTCGDLLACFLHLHARLRVRSSHRHSLCPLAFEGRWRCRTRADPAAGMQTHILSTVTAGLACPPKPRCWRERGVQLFQRRLGSRRTSLEYWIVRSKPGRRRRSRSLTFAYTPRRQAAPSPATAIVPHDGPARAQVGHAGAQFVTRAFTITPPPGTLFVLLR